MPRDLLLFQDRCALVGWLRHGLMAGLASLVLLLCFGRSAWGAQKPEPLFRNDRILVKPKAGVNTAALHAAAKAHVHRTYKAIGGLQVIKLPAGANVKNVIAQYQASGQVEYAEPDYEVHLVDMPNDPRFTDGSLWGLYNYGQNGGTAGADIHATQAWDTRNSSPNIIVAVIDTGIRYTHEDLAANIWINSGEIAGNGVDDDGDGYIDDIHGINAITGSGDPMDDHGHGSHVSGTIGAAGNNGIGVVGVTRQVKLMGCKFLDSSGSGSTTDAIECIDYARVHGANIMSNSWGGGGFSQALKDAITAAGNAGILFVAAAGNNSSNNDATPTYPASYGCDNIVVVAATNRNDALSSFSNYGPTTVHLGAPGEDIISCWNTSDSAYNTISGTSMATPHVSGALALMKAQYPSLTYQQLISALLTSADQIPALAGKCVSNGRLNLLQALNPSDLRVAPYTGLFSSGTPGGPFAPSSQNYTLQNGNLSNTLTWTASNTQPWLSLSSTGGTLTPGATATVTVSINGSANSLAVGTYSDTVTFTNVTTGSGTKSVAVTLLVAQNYTMSAGTFSWIDPSLHTNLGSGDDTVSAAQTLPFTFSFYGQPYTQLYVGSNGLIGFNSTGMTAYTNADIPNTAAPNNQIYPWWDDLDASSAGSVRAGTVGTAPNRQYVVSWVGVPHYGTSNGFTFQAVLCETSNLIILQYLDVQAADNTNGAGKSATVGVENSTGQVARKYSYNGSTLLSNSQALRFIWDNTPPAVTVDQAASQPDPTSLSPINFTVVFSEPVVDFTANKVALSGSAGVTTAVVSGTGPTYNVEVSGMGSSGTVMASIPAGAVHDLSGNANVASTSTDNTVTYVLSNLIWNGGSTTTDNWSDDANWSGAHLIPASNLIFAGTDRLTPINDTAASTVYGSIRFDAGGFTLTGNAVALHALTGVNNTAGSNTVNLPVSLDMPLSITAAAGTTLTLDAIVNSGNLLTVDSAGTCRLGLISGAGGLTKSGGAGSTVLLAANSYTGPTTVNSGTLCLGFNNAISSSSGLVIGAGGTVDLSDGASPFLQAMTELNGAGLLTNSAIGFALLTVNTVNTDTYSGMISGPINLQKEGSGALILAGANSYTGTTAVNAGALRVQNASALGNTLAGATVASGAALEIEGGQAVAAAPLALNGAGIGGAGALHSLSGANSMSGAIALNSNATVAVDAGQLTLNGVISGGSSLTKTGAGTLLLASDNTYAGATTVNAGALWVNGSQPSSPVSVEAAATLGGTGTVGMIASTGGTISPGLVRGGAPVVNGGFESGDFAGWTIINNGSGVGETESVVNSGGTEGTYHAALIVPSASGAPGWRAYSRTIRSSTFAAMAGTPVSFDWKVVLTYDYPRARAQLFDAGSGLAVYTFFNQNFSATTAWATASYTVPAAGNYYLEFQGGSYDSTLGGVLGAEFHVDNVRSQAALGGQGVLNVNGNTTLDAASTFSVLLNGVGAGTGYSQLKASGAVDLGGCALGVAVAFSPAAGTQFTIIENDGGGAVSNTFNGLPEGGSIVLGPTTLKVSYRGGAGGNSVVLTSSVTPVPVISSAAAASGIVGTAFTYQITATNSPTSYNAAPLPAGLSVNTGTGAITGTPTTAGTTSVTISATNAGGTGSATLTITINLAYTTIANGPWSTMTTWTPSTGYPTSSDYAIVTNYAVTLPSPQAAKQVTFAGQGTIGALGDGQALTIGQGGNYPAGIGIIETQPAGFQGKYYNSPNMPGTNPSFSDPGVTFVTTRLDRTIDFNFQNANALPLGVGINGPNDFMVMWDGYIVPNFTEAYTFYTRSDDGIRSYLGQPADTGTWWNAGNILTNAWVFRGVPGNWDTSAPRNLTAGVRYPIHVEYFQGGGGCAAYMQWSSPSTPQADIVATSASVGTISTDYLTFKPATDGTLCGTINVQTAGSAVVINSKIVGNYNGTDGLRYNGSSGNTLTLNGVSGINNFTGSTTFGGGTLVLGDPLAFGGSTLCLLSTVSTPCILSTSTAMTIANPWSLGGNITLASPYAMTYSGAVALTGNPIVTVSTSALQKMNGVISGAGSLGLAGTGTLALNAANTYSGGTVINGGTLLANTTGTGNCATGTGLVTVNGGGTLSNDMTIVGSGSVGGDVSVSGTAANPGTVAGSLSIAGALTINDFGIVSPAGSGTAGTINVGSFTATSQANLNFDLNSPDPSINDLINVTGATGTVQLNGVLTVTPGASFCQGTGPWTYTILNSTLPITDNGLAVLVSGYGYQVVIDNVSATKTVKLTFRAATTRYWTGGSETSNNWSDGANWKDGNNNPGAPFAADSLVFQGSTRLTPNNDYAGGTMFSAINLSSGGFTLNGNQVRLGGAPTDSPSPGGLLNSSGTNTCNLPILQYKAMTIGAADNTTLGMGGRIDTSSFALTVNPGNTGTINLNGVIAGAGSVVVATPMNGGSNTCVVSFGADNSYTGGTTLSGDGIVAVNTASTPFGSIASAVTYTNASYTKLRADTTARTIPNAVTLNADLTINSGQNITFAGTVTLAVADRTITVGSGVTASFTATTPIAGTGFGLTKAGLGTMQIAGLCGFNKSLVINGGTVVLSSYGQLPAMTTQPGIRIGPPANGDPNLAPTLLLDDTVFVTNVSGQRLAAGATQGIQFDSGTLILSVGDQDANEQAGPVTFNSGVNYVTVTKTGIGRPLITAYSVVEQNSATLLFTRATTSPKGNLVATSGMTDNSMVWWASVNGWAAVYRNPANVANLDGQGFVEVSANAKSTIASGMWNDPNTWLNGALPVDGSPGQDVLIRHIVTMDADHQVRSVTFDDQGLATPAIVNPSGQNYALTVYSGVVNSQGNCTPSIGCNLSFVTAAGINVASSGDMTISGVVTSALDNVLKIGYWHFDEGTGTSASDTSNTNNPLTLKGTPPPSWTVASAVGPYAVQFDGVQNYASLDQVNGLAVNNQSHTLAGWVYVTAYPTSQPAVMLVLGKPQASAHQWLLNSNGTVQLGPQGGNQFSTALPKNQWTHIAVVYEGVGSSGNMQCYINGVPIGSPLSATITLAPIGTNTHPPLALAQAGASQSFFNGCFDDLRLTASKLTDANIAVFYSLRGGLTKYGSGNLVLSGNNTFYYPASVAAGMLYVSQDGNLGSAYDPTSLTSGSLVNLTGGALGALGNLSINRPISCYGGAIDTGAYTVTATSYPMLGGGSLAKQGLGRLLVSVPSLRAGATTINAGTASVVSNATALGSGAVTVNSGGVLELNGITGDWSNNLALNDGSTLRTTNVGTKTLKGYVTIGVLAQAAIEVNSSDLLRIGGIATGQVIGGSGNKIAKTGTGTLQLDSDNSSSLVGGWVQVNAGVLRVGNDNTTSQGVGTDTIVVNPGGTFASDSSTAVSNAIVLNGGTLCSARGDRTFSGQVTVNAGSIVSLDDIVMPGTPRSVTLSGVLAGSANLDVNNGLGSGKGLFLTNSASLYTGTIRVNAGATLAGSGTISGSTGSATINAGGTLGGTLTLYGGATVNTGGTVSPAGAGTPGSLNLGPLTLNSGASLSLDLGSTSDLDTVLVNKGAGSLALGGILNVNALTGFGTGAYTIMTCTGTPPGALKVGTMPSGYYGTINTATSGQVKLVVSTLLTWIWLGSTGNWSTAANWSPNSVPTSGASTELDFGGSGTTSYTSTNDISGTFQLNKMVLNSTATVTEIIAGNPLQFMPNGGASGTNGTILQNGSGAFNITANITIASGNTLVLGGSGSGIMTLSGTISGSGAILICPTGNAAFDFTGTNFFSGGVTLNSGRLLVGSAQALGSGRLTVNGGTLRVDSSAGGDLTITNAVTINNDLALAESGLISPIHSLTLRGNVDLTTGTRVLTANYGPALGTTFSGVVSNGSLTKAGNYILTLSGTSANTMTSTNVPAGTLLLSKNAGVAALAGSVTIGGPTSTLPNSYGLLANYFQHTSSTSPLTPPAVLTRFDPTINYSSTGWPPSPVASSYFSARWTGKFQATTNEIHTFYAPSADGYRLWFDGIKVLDFWTANQTLPSPLPGNNSWITPAALTAGSWHDIMMEYRHEATASYGANLYLKTPTITPAIPIPMNQLLTSNVPAIVWHKLDDGTAGTSATAGTSVADSSGNGYGTGGAGNTGTVRLSGTASAGWAPGRAGNSALQLNCVDQNNTAYVSTAVPSTNPQSFTIALWFKTAAGYTGGGRLIGFGSNQTGLSTTFDRAIYMTNFGTVGQVAFGIVATNKLYATSTSTYNDGNWHQAVAVMDSPTQAVATPATITTTITLYVDGAKVGSSSTTNTPSNYAGYWRLGWDSLSGWQNISTAATNPWFFTGTLDDARIYGRALSPSEVTQLFAPPVVRLVSSDQLAHSASVTILSGAMLDLNNNAATIDALSGPGLLALGSGTLTVGNSGGSSQFDGLIAGTGGLTKTGAGTFTLTSANVYGGITAVNAGTLMANNTTGSATGTGAVQISGANAGSAFLRGTGTITGAITAGTSAPLYGTIWPGATGATPIATDAKGSLTAKSADFSNNGTLVIRGSNSAPDTAPLCDKLTLTGNSNPLVLGGSPGATLVVYAHRESGSYNADRDTLIVDTPGPGASPDSTNYITSAFNTVTIYNDAGPTTSILVVYKDKAGNEIAMPSVATPAKQIFLRFQVTTSTSLASSPNPSTYGTPVTLTATVTAIDGGTPTGAVTFMDGAATLGMGMLSSGTATYATSVSQLACGPHSITAVYGGDTSYAASTSAPPLTQTVNQRTLTVMATGRNKVYDGTTTATVALSDDRITGDVFTDNCTTAAFDTPDVGTGKAVTVSGISISGADAGNYTCNTTATTTADIVATLQITARETQDTNGNGYIDAIRIVTNAPFDDSFAGLEITVAGCAVTGYDTGSGANDNEFFVLLQEHHTTPDTGDTDATPDVQVVAAGGLGIPVDADPVTPTDKAKPVLLSAVWGGGSGGGVSPNDPIYLTFSEPVTSNSALAADFGLPVANDTCGVGATVSPGQNEQNPKVLTLTLHGNPLLTPGGVFSPGALTAGSATGIYVADGTRIVDVAGNTALVQTIGTAVDLQPGAENVSICWDDLSIAPRDWNIGDSHFAAAHQAFGYFPPNGLIARNNGNVREKFTVNCSTSYPAGWAVAATAGQDQFELKASNSGPPYTTYPLDLATGPQAIASHLYSGYDQAFDLQIKLPTSGDGSMNVAQTICVWVTATKD